MAELAIRAGNRISQIPPLPFATESHDDVILTYRADAARKQAVEAKSALNRIADRTWSAHLLNASITPFLLDPVHSEGDIRAYGRVHGVDVDDLCKRAGMNFSTPEIKRRLTPLTAEELKFLIDDDERAFDR